MTEVEMKILQKYAGGAELKNIASDLDVDQEQVTEVASAVGFERGRARQLLRDHDAAAAKARTRPAETTPAPERPTVSTGVNAVLARADEAGGKFKVRATHLRTMVERLRCDLDAQTEVIAAEKEVERLRAELAEATEKLRAAKAPALSGTPIPPAGPIVDFRAVREWAAANDVPCAQSGRVPNHVIKAYNDARRGSAA